VFSNFLFLGSTGTARGSAGADLGSTGPPAVLGSAGADLGSTGPAVLGSAGADLGSACLVTEMVGCIGVP
jgi:hypothetical protein